MIREPPFDGAVQESDTLALPCVAVTALGAPGSTAGVTEGEANDAGPVPVELVAVTVKVYGVPLSLIHI